MHRWSPLVIALACLVCPTPVASASANQPPTAAAGLDQTVPAGTTVYLDAGGSTDADGRITATEWSIRAPNGSTLTPSCRECMTPTFTPDATGRWAVTVTVTDDDGATASDTLYVSVGEPRGPDLSIQAPETTASSTLTPISVEAVADDTELRRVEIFHDDTRVDRFSVSGDETTITTSTVFGSTGPAELLAVATDEQGYVTTRTVTVEVVETTSGGGATSPTSTGSSGGSNSGSASTTSSGSSSLGDTGRCRAVRFGGEIHTPGSCDENEDEIMHVLDDEGNIVGRQLVDTSGDGDLTMSVDATPLDEPKNVAVGEHVDRSQYEVDTGNHVVAVDYEAIDGKVERAVVEEARANNRNNDDDSSDDQGGVDGRDDVADAVDRVFQSSDDTSAEFDTDSSTESTEPSTESTEPSTEPTEPNYGGGSSDPPSPSSPSGSSGVDTGTSFSPSEPSDRTDPSSTSGDDSGGSSNDGSGRGPSYSPSEPTDRTNPPSTSGSDSSSGGGSTADSSSTSGGTSGVNTGTSFSPSPGDRSSPPTDLSDSSSSSGGDSGGSSNDDSSSSSSSGSTDTSSSSPPPTYSPPNGVNRYGY